jgi:hypothetical protein
MFFKKLIQMKRIFTTLTAIFLLSSSLFAQTLVAYYPFNGNTNDASGHGTFYRK